MNNPEAGPCLFVDGENFRKYANIVYQSIDVPNSHIDNTRMDISRLLHQARPDVHMKVANYYGAKVREYQPVREWCQMLAQDQDLLTSSLRRQGINYIKTGQLLLRDRLENGETIYLFKEKGVDVQIAVDMVSFAFKGRMDHAYLFSSDTDLIPAVRQVQSLGIGVTYVGFEYKPVKRMEEVADDRILVTDEQVLDAIRLKPNSSLSYRKVQDYLLSLRQGTVS